MRVSTAEIFVSRLLGTVQRFHRHLRRHLPSDSEVPSSPPQLSSTTWSLLRSALTLEFCLHANAKISGAEMVPLLLLVPLRHYIKKRNCHITVTGVIGAHKAQVYWSIVTTPSRDPVECISISTVRVCGEWTVSKAALSGAYQRPSFWWGGVARCWV